MNKTVYADLDTIVFEGREMDYGAFKMRSGYNRVLSRSLLIAFLLFLSITGLPKVIQWISPGGGENMITMVEFEPEDIGPLPEVKPREEDPVEPPPPVKEYTPPPPQRAQIEFRVIEPAPVDETDQDATITDMTELIDLDSVQIGFENIDGAATDGMGDIDWDVLIPGGPGDGPVELTKEEDPKHTDLFAGEEPRPVNINSVRDLIGYPPQAVEAEIEGKVVVRVLVNKRGTYKKHVVLADPHRILTRAVEAQLDELIFTPGIQNNKPVNVWVTIPFDFKLRR